MNEILNMSRVPTSGFLVAYFFIGMWIPRVSSILFIISWRLQHILPMDSRGLISLQDLLFMPDQRLVDFPKEILDFPWVSVYLFIMGITLEIHTAYLSMSQYLSPENGFLLFELMSLASIIWARVFTCYGLIFTDLKSYGNYCLHYLRICQWNSLFI